MYSTSEAAPLKSRNNNAVTDTDTTSPTHQLCDEAKQAEAENQAPRIRPIPYPKLPSAISPPKPKQNAFLDHHVWLRDIPQRSPITPSCANIGRRRANAVSLMNSPARQSHSEEMMRIFRETQQTSTCDLRETGGGIFSETRPLSKSRGSQIRPIRVTDDPVQSPSRLPRLQSNLPLPSLKQNDSQSRSPRTRLPQLTAPVRITQNSAAAPKPDCEHVPSERPTTPSQGSGVKIVENTCKATQRCYRDAGDWTDDEKFLYPPTSTAVEESVQVWLDGLANSELDNASLPNSSSPSSNSSDSPSKQEQRTHVSASSIAEIIRLKSPMAQTPQRPGSSSSNPTNEERQPRGVLSTLLKPPCRTPHRSGLHRRREVTDSPVQAKHPRARRHLTPSEPRKLKDDCVDADNSLFNTVQCHDVSLPHRKDRIPEFPSLNTNQEEPADECAILELTPEVQKFRRGKGPKQTRRSSYYDRDIIQQRDA